MIFQHFGVGATVLLLLASEYCRADRLATCQPNDFHYEFTECDDREGRWRVSVPTPGACIGGAPNPPERDNCTKSCEAGFFYNKSNLHCHPCPPGTFSLGGGVMFDTWHRIPQDFHTSSESFESSFRFVQPSGTDRPINCSDYGWKTKGAFIYSEGGPCSAVLGYSVRLLKSGELTYIYQYTDDSIMFSFEAQNDRCQSMWQSGRYKFPPRTEEGKWSKESLHLPEGQYVLYWKTVGIGVGDINKKNPNPVRIKSISLTGVAYASECTKCEAGTYSERGASECTACPENKYSALPGLPSCSDCRRTEYSTVGSKRCLPKPPCTALDYYKVFSTCDNQQSEISYRWREPKICRSDLAGSIKLPSKKRINGCMKCNPGMEQSRYSNCTFCPSNHYSDGSSGCRSCPASTAPNYGLYYGVWNQMPPFVSSKCISFEEGSCGSTDTWIADGQYVRTSSGHGEDSFLLLTVPVPGFRSKERIVNGMPTEIGVVRFTFSLNCTFQCDFIFMEASSQEDFKAVRSWKGNQVKETFSYSVRRNDSYTFTWAFQKLPFEISTKGDFESDTSNDVAVIYAITITNTITGGASECVNCPKGTESEGCIPCPPGHYLETNGTRVCTRCPQNHYVSESLASGVESCKQCGPGLRSDDGQVCYSDCHLYIADYAWFDFSGLPRFVEVKGSTLFTGSGTQFYHVFNISLCGAAGPETTCKNNVSQQRSDVQSMVCRSTIVPSQGVNSGHVIATQSVSIGDWLIGITRDKTYQNISVSEYFIEDPDSVSDIHFYYVSSGRTAACPMGRNTTVTLRCDMFVKDPGEINTPAKCPDGTCDGCNFHFLWKTRKGCRVCSENDYEVVNGECKRGEQTLHYILPKGCIPHGDDDKPLTHTRMCSIIPFDLQVVIAGSVCLGILLLALVLYCWKKNRRLEYKYMKLVQSGSSKDGELPTAESCAIYDDDEDQYDAVVTEKKGPGLLAKFHPRGSNDCSETIHLTKSSQI